MTSVMDRLTDAMNAAASTVREQELRPLVAPQRRPARRRWRQASWVAPIAAGAAVVLVIGLAAAVSNGLFRTSRPGPTAHLPAAPYRFYLTTDLGTWQTAIRSTATGKVVAVVPVPSLRAVGEEVAPALAVAANGTFYIAAFRHGVPGEQIYRFRLTAAGHVAGFERVRGGLLRPGWAADALAASPDGSLVAVGAHYTYGRGRSDQLLVIHTATGTQSLWRGGPLPHGYKFFGLSSLSWTANGHELAVLGQWCRATTDPGGELCPRWERQAQLRAIDPAGGHGGSVLAGRLLLAQSPRLPFLAQALISPDGSVITAMVLHGRVVGNKQISGFFPANLSVVRISVATGYEFSLLYQRRLGDTSEISGGMADPLTLIADPSGRSLIIDGGICNLHCSNGFNGWLRAERLIPLRPAGFAHREASEAW